MDSIVSAKKAAQLLGVSTRTIQRYCREYGLPTATDGREQYLIDMSYVLHWRKQVDKPRERRAIERISIGDLNATIMDWLDWCATGKLGGRIVGARTLELYEYYFDKYLDCLKDKTTLPITSADKFREVLEVIPKEMYSTRKHIYDAVMSMTKYLVQTRGFSKADREEIRMLRPSRHLPAVKPVLTEMQLDELMDKLNDAEFLTHAGAYCKLLNQTLIQFISKTGLRVSEVCNLKKTDVDLRSNCVYVYLGKGMKNRKVGIPHGLREWLVKYIEKTENDTEFFFVDKVGNQMTPDKIGNRFKRMSARFGIKVTAHALRRTFVTINANNGKPLNHLRLACGHSSLETTQGYCLTEENEVVKAMQNW